MDEMSYLMKNAFAPFCKQFISCWAADCCSIGAISNDLNLTPNKPHFIMTFYPDSIHDITYVKSAHMGILSSFIDFQNLKSSEDFPESP